MKMILALIVVFCIGSKYLTQDTDEKMLYDILGAIYFIGYSICVTLDNRGDK